MWRRKKLQWAQLRKPENNRRAMLNPSLNSLCYWLSTDSDASSALRGAMHSTTSVNREISEVVTGNTPFKWWPIGWITRKEWPPWNQDNRYREERCRLRSYEHAIHRHADTPNFSDIFEVDIVYRLPEHRGNNASDSRNRRRWGKILSPWAKKVADRAVNISFSCSSLPLYALSMSFPSRNSIAILSDFRIFHAAFSGGVSASTEFQNFPTSKNAYTGQSSLFKNSFNNINWLEFGSYIRSDRRDRM